MEYSKVLKIVMINGNTYYGIIDEYYGYRVRVKNVCSSGYTFLTDYERYTSLYLNNILYTCIAPYEEAVKYFECLKKHYENSPKYMRCKRCGCTFVIKNYPVNADDSCAECSTINWELIHTKPYNKGDQSE